MPVTSLWSDFIVEESHHEQCTPMNEAGLVLEGRIQDRLGIIVPCHRIVGSNGSLTGYAGGLAKKRALLALEGCV